MSVGHVAQVAMAGLGLANMHMMQGGVAVLADNNTDVCTDITEACQFAPFEACKRSYDLSEDLRAGDRGYQVVAFGLVLAGLIAWVRRATNQKAIVLAFGVEGVISLFHRVAYLYFLRDAQICQLKEIGFEYSASSRTLAEQVLSLLARLAQIIAAFAAASNKSNTVGLLFTGACIIYFLVWFGFAATEPAGIGGVFERYPDNVNAVARSLPGAVAGIILAIQRAPATGEGVEMP